MSGAPGTRSAEVDVLIAWLRQIVRHRATGAWERRFCASILARDRRGRFVPSDRQLDCMRRVVRDFRAEVVERD